MAGGSGSSNSGAMGFAAASAGLDLLAGIFGYMAAGEIAGLNESRGRMIRMEAEAEAQQYAEQARSFKASQKLAYLKSGVRLEGSPLDVLDETARVAMENISAIRARGRAGETEAYGQASQARTAGNQALMSGITSGAGKLAWASYMDSKTAMPKTPASAFYSPLRPSQIANVGPR